jgi:hypothetical protein
MKEWSSARGILVLLSLLVAAGGSVFLVRSGLLTGAGEGKGVDEQAEEIRRNEACLKRIEELERVYREEILPTRERLIRNREQLEAFLRTLPPGIGGEASDRGLVGGWPSPSESEGERGLSWARIQEALRGAAQDPRIRGEGGSAGQDRGQEAFQNPSPPSGNGYVQ